MCDLQTNESTGDVPESSAVAAEKNMKTEEKSWKSMENHEMFLILQ